MAMVVLAALAYERLSLRIEGWNKWRGLAFMSGCVVLVAALGTHSHDFAGHMTQHVLVGMVAPIGLVLGAPGTLLLRFLPTPQGRWLMRVLRSRPVRYLTHPGTVLLLAAGTPVLLYCTPLYSYGQSSPALHTLILTHFLISGCLFAWVVAGPDPAPHRPPVPVRLVLLGIAIAVHATLSQLLYAGVFVDVAAQVADRQAGATLMYYGGDVAELLLAFAVVQSRTAAARTSASRGQRVARAGRAWRAMAAHGRP
jgi:putative membrane protein